MLHKEFFGLSLNSLNSLNSLLSPFSFLLSSCSHHSPSHKKKTISFDIVFSALFALSCFRGLPSLLLGFPLLLPQGRHQSNQRERVTTSVALLFFFIAIGLCKQVPNPIATKKKVKLSFHLLIVCFELFPRIELGTSSLPRKCSTTELKQHLLPKSEAKVQRYFQLCNFFGENFLQKLLATATTKHTTN